MRLYVQFALTCLFYGFVTSFFFPPPPENTLVLLHVLFRHGNRAPDVGSTFPTDQYKNQTYPPYGYSQLTLKGQKTEYEIGKYLRKTYGNLIPSEYTPQVASALCTNFKRTKISLNLVLSGLFPSTNNERFDGAPSNWQPIAYDVEPTSGVLGSPFYYCPNFVSPYYAYMFKREARDVIASYKSLYQTLSKVTGLKVKTPEDVMNVYMTLKCQEDFGLKLPSWAKDIYPKTLEEAASVLYEFATSSTTLKKQTAGFLIQKILQDTNAKIDDELPDERKVFLYSAHEFNVASMLRLLGVFYRHVPPFGATIFFEIHNIKGQYGLKLLYQDYTETNPKLLTIPGCDSFCPLHNLTAIIQDNLPTPSDVCIPSGEIY